MKIIGEYYQIKLKANVLDFLYQNLKHIFSSKIDEISQTIRTFLEQKYAEDGCGLPINFQKSNYPSAFNNPKIKKGFRSGLIQLVRQIYEGDSLQGEINWDQELKLRYISLIMRYIGLVDNLTIPPEQVPSNCNLNDKEKLQVQLFMLEDHYTENVEWMYIPMKIKLSTKLIDILVKQTNKKEALSFWLQERATVYMETADDAKVISDLKRAYHLEEGDLKMDLKLLLEEFGVQISG